MLTLRFFIRLNYHLSQCSGLFLTCYNHFSDSGSHLTIGLLSMKKTGILLVLSSCLFLTPSVYAERMALLIGNSAYRVKALRNPSNDVDKMAQKLRTLGFKRITARKNLTKAQMKQVIRQFSQQLKAGDEALFYYSGHGAQANNLNYLIPVRTDIQAEDEVADEAIPLRFVLNKLRNTRAKLNLVILDACRDNPFKSRFKNMKRGLARINQQVGQSTLVAFSASANQVSDDGNRGNGLYTQYLLQHLATPNITLTQMFTKVRNGVYNASGGKQHPKEENGLLQEVYLNKTGRVDNGDAERRRQAEILRQQQLQQAQQQKVRQQQVQQKARQAKIHQQQLKAQQAKARQQHNNKVVVKTSGRRIGQYIDHGDGTVTDTKTKLIWQKCTVGQSGNNCTEGFANFYGWREIPNRFMSEKYNDWRMPTEAELMTLVYCNHGVPRKETGDKGCKGSNYQSPTINTTAFPNTKNYWYWSSTRPDKNSAKAWGIFFFTGENYKDGQGRRGHVRLVRGTYNNSKQQTKAFFKDAGHTL